MMGQSTILPNDRQTCHLPPIVQAYSQFFSLSACSSCPLPACELQIGWAGVNSGSVDRSAIQDIAVVLAESRDVLKTAAGGYLAEFGVRQDPR